ncbi:hypothetical protein H2202_003620 [Exophiala xenobiotica]|nr:hypothetical protein H2202_003620 [Exophiala xenobiotica]
MTYESQVSFTLDTISLRRFRQSDDAKSTTFLIKYFPYQLYPEASKEGEDKYDWYKKSRYGDTDDKLKMYTTLMTAYGESAGIKFKFGGTMANTLDAHRVIQHFQEEKGAETADKIINSYLCQALYSQFFENERNPSSQETLLKATSDAGISEDEAKAVIEDQNEGLMDVKALIREQASNGVDSVPTIIFEGKRRDFTLIGAKDVEEYEKVLHQVAKESK